MHWLLHFRVSPQLATHTLAKRGLCRDWGVGGWEGGRKRAFWGGVGWAEGDAVTSLVRCGGVVHAG